MRLAIFSDVHGNLTALQSVLDDIDRQPPLDAIIFAGDLCVFGPRPQECVDLIMQRDIQSIVGNTDEWIRKPPQITDNMDENLRQRRRQLQKACRWTEHQLDRSSLNWIDSLLNSFQLRFSPTSNPIDDMLIVHANPIDLVQIIFPDLARQIELYGRVRQRDEELEILLNSVDVRAITFGHLHIPGLRVWKNKRLFNISSVSLPGDGDYRAKYAIVSWLPESGWSVQHFKVPYPIEDEIKAFQDVRPPDWEVMIEQLTSIGYNPQVV